MTPLFIHGVLLATLLIVPSVFPQSIDEIIASSYESADEFDVLFDLEGKVIRHDLDMLLTRDQAIAMNLIEDTRKMKDDPRASRVRRKAIRAETYRWDNKVVPYTIASGVFSDSDRYQIEQALAEWRKYTCLTFRQANRNDEHKVYFDNGKGCYSYVGLLRQGSQKIGLAPGCRFKGVIIHEIGHAIGFQHEQNRPDRDNYVRIINESIPEGLYYNFKKYPYSTVATMGVPYDYGSVMHYGGKAFSINGRDTIKTLNPKDQGKIGNRKGLSFNDIWLANLMYKCSDGCDQSIQCPRGAFMGKDCKCWCPGYPYTECASTGTVATTTRGPTKPTSVPKCDDRNKYCPKWAEYGYCNRNTYVKTYCRRSCGFCSDTKPTTVAYCKDSIKSCAAWGERGYCKGDFESFMSEKCPKTCKVCSRASDGTNKEQSEGSAGFVSGSFAVAISYSVLVISKKLV